MRILGLDVGEKRIGVSISDPMGIISQALETIQRQDLETDLAGLRSLIKQNSVEKVVIGLPINMNGSRGPAAEKAVAFSEELKKGTDIPISMWDERLTTLQVEKNLLYADVSRYKRKKIADMLAAQVILQSYLDSKKRQ